MSAPAISPSAASTSSPGPINANRRRRVREAAQLMVKSATRLVNLPILQDSARATQELVVALQVRLRALSKSLEQGPAIEMIYSSTASCFSGSREE